MGRFDITITARTNTKRASISRILCDFFIASSMQCIRQVSSKPPLVVPRTIRGGGIFEENDRGDMPQILECSEICYVRIPSVPSGQLPLCPRGAFGDLQFHQPSAAVGADGVVHVVHVAAVGAGDLLDPTCFRRFRVAEQIKFELFAALTALDIHIERTG